MLRFDSIRDRLVIGLGLCVLLILGAGVTARFALDSLGSTIAATLGRVQTDSDYSAQLASNTARQLAVAARYLDRRDSASLRAFDALGFESHAITRAMTRQDEQSAEDIALIATIDRALADLEVRYARAHRLADLGRQAEARAEADRVAPLVDALLDDVRRLSAGKAAEARLASERLEGDAQRWSFIVVTGAALASALGAFIVFTALSRIAGPLALLVGQARALTTGNYDARLDAELPGEFRDLAHAMNTAGEQLRAVTEAATRASNEVSASAHELSSVTEQVATSASHMASAMTDVTSGAEAQVRELRQVEEQLGQMRTRAQGVLAGAEQVSALSTSIEETAAEKRLEIERALAMLGGVRDAVTGASDEVQQLSSAVDDISRFVTSVGRIAEQTNLLALNAAIEAARAGAAGRGFSVVAEEVRRLAEQAQAAADDVVKLTQGITRRVGTASRSMASSVGAVGDIERAAMGLDEALGAIAASAERTRAAASSVIFGAMENVQAAEGSADGLQVVARMAEQHVAAAEQVSAATQEQSAACEEMTASAQFLLEQATRLRTLVGRLRADEG